MQPHGRPRKMSGEEWQLLMTSAAVLLGACLGLCTSTAVALKPKGASGVPEGLIEC